MAKLLNFALSHPQLLVVMEHDESENVEKPSGNISVRVRFYALCELDTKASVLLKLTN